MSLHIHKHSHAKTHTHTHIHRKTLKIMWNNMPLNINKDTHTYTRKHYFAPITPQMKLKQKLY